MQILSINSYLNKNIFLYPDKKEKKFSDVREIFSNLSPLKQDTVSFKGKNYSLDKIKEPTGHCAYCGEKVYSDREIDALCVEVMKLKGARLGGKLRSILEKLDMPDNYTDLAVDKRKMNKEHIAFFRQLSSFSNNSGSQTGLELLIKNAGFKDENEVKEEIKSHLKPLLKTVDHITPQRKNIDNSDEDINLVETCYTCNHDLKQGMEFSEFNSLYPSIEKHMPEYKYQYALANVLENSGNQVRAEISSQNLLKMLDTLSSQRAHAISTLDSINLRFKNCFEDIRSSLSCSKKEKAEKEAQIAALEKEKEGFYMDEEHSVRQKQAVLTSELKELMDKKISLNGSIYRLNDKIGEVVGTEHIKSKKKKQLTEKQAEQKKAEIMLSIDETKSELSKVEKEIEEKQEKFDAISEKYTPLPELTAEKSQYDDVISAYDKFEENVPEEERRQKALDKALAEELELDEILKRQPPPDVTPDKCTPDERSQFEKYKSLIDLLNKMSQTMPQSDTTRQIYAHAQSNIENEISSMMSNPLIAKAEFKRGQYLAKTKQPKVTSVRQNAEAQLAQIQKEQEKYSELKAICSRDEAVRKSQELSKEITRVQGIYDDLKIVDKINSAKTELKLIQSTISNLENALKKESEYLPQ